MAIIKYSQLLEDDGAIEDLEKKIDDLEKFVKSKGKGLEKSLNVVSPEETEQVRKLAAEVEQLKKAQIELDKLKKKSNTTKKKSADLTKKELIALEEERDALNKNKKEARAVAKLKNTQAGSIENLRAKLSVVTIQWAKLTEEERENTARGQRLVKVKTDLTQELKRVESQTGDTRRSVGNYKEEVKAAIRELEAEKKSLAGNVSILRKQQNELKKGGAAWNQYEKKIQEAETRLNSVNNELGETDLTPKGGGGNLLAGLGDKFKGGGAPDLSQLTGGGGGGGALGGAFSKLGGLASSLGPIGIAVGAIVASVGALGAAILDVEKKFSKLRGEIQKTTGAFGGELDAITVNTVALAETFGAEQTELVRAQNVLMKEFNLTAGEAFEVLEDGYLSAANSQGDLLDSISEYSTQIKASGGDAKDLIKILDKSGKKGIYSDKGIDTVKEFGLRIREQTKSTRDSLEDAFGKEFSDKVLGGISDGSITTLEALEQISGAMGDTTIPTEKLQTVIADTFGGAGEDAGLEFIKTF